MSEIYLETAPEKTKRTMKKHRLWLWLPRSVALLIIVCFFFPWYLDGWTGIFTHYKSGVQFVVESIRDTNWSEVQNPLFFQLKVLYSSFPVVGALVFLITSVKKNKKWEAIAYALYAITSSSMLIAILIIHRDLRFRIVPDVPATWVLLGTIPVFVILSLIYLYLMRSRNIRMLQFYIIFILSLFGLLFVYHLNVGFLIQPAFDVTGFATLAYLVFAYQSFMDSLPPRKQKRGFQTEI